MATLLLGAAGAGLAGSFGFAAGSFGAVALQTAGVIGGAVIDEALIRALAPQKAPQPAQNIPITTAQEDVPIKKLWGRMRLGGNVIWCTKFKQGVEDVPGQ